MIGRRVYWFLATCLTSTIYPLILRGQNSLIPRSSVRSFVSFSNSFIDRRMTTIDRLRYISHWPVNHARSLSMKVEKTEDEWKSILTPNQFAVLRLKATEPPGFSERSPGELEYELKKKQGTKYPKTGHYECVGCGSALYTSKSKFDSGCGWPAFYEGVPGAVKEIPDADGRRIEILCNNCGSHLGHVFKGEGFPTPTDERHCVNGICLRYNPTKSS